MDLIHQRLMLFVFKTWTGDCVVSTVQYMVKELILQGMQVTVITILGRTRWATDTCLLLKY